MADTINSLRIGFPFRRFRTVTHARNRFPGRVAALVLWLAALSATVAAPRLDVRTGADKIWLGDPYVVQIMLTDAPPDDIPAPVFRNSGGAEIRTGNPQRQSTASVTIINGKRTAEQKHVVTWVCNIIPHEAGTFAPGAVSLTVSGDTLSSPVPPVTVVGPDEQAYVSVAVSAPRHEVVPEEEFTVSVEITARRIDGNFAAQDPFPGGNYQPALLEIPFINAGIVANAALANPVENIVNPLLQRRESAGFRINNITVNDSPGGMFGFPSMFAETRNAVFYPARTGDETHFKYVFEFPFKALSPGNAVFPPVRFKGDIMFVNDAGALASGRIFAVSDSLVIRVANPPAEGRPASFIGSLATRLEAVASLDAQTCREGDPLLLTLELHGDPTLANMRAPDITLAKNFHASFRRYGDTETENPPGAVRRFKYKIRPVSSGTIELPAIPVSYFDLRDRSYKTVFTAPIPLRVNPAPELANPFGTNSETLFLPAKQRRVSGLADNVFPGDVRIPSFAFHSLAIKFALPPLLFFAFVGAAKLWLIRSRIAGMFRARSASARALRRIAKAKKPAAIFVALSALCRKNVMTPDEFEGVLSKSDIAPERADELRKHLREVFNAPFDPSADPARTVVKLRARIAELLAGVKFAAALLLFVGTLARADDFTMKHAETLAASASTPAEFAEAAQVLRPLLQPGKRPLAGSDSMNPGLLYKYGTLMLLAEENAAALDAFSRAETLAGSVPETANNMAVAYGDSVPWLRAPLFWHYGVSLAARFNAMLAAWWAFWAGLLLRRIRFRRIGTVVAIFGLVCALTLIASVAASKTVLDKPLPEPVRKGAAK